jgi:hypothetical protein
MSRQNTTNKVCTDGSFARVIFSTGPPMRPLIKRLPSYLFETLRRGVANMSIAFSKARGLPTAGSSTNQV